VCDLALGFGEGKLQNSVEVYFILSAMFACMLLAGCFLTWAEVSTNIVFCSIVLLFYCFCSIICVLSVPRYQTPNLVLICPDLSVLCPSGAEDGKKKMSRPFGVALLMAGHDDQQGSQLYFSDPSGTLA
jgi:hypothetical protein